MRLVTPVKVLLEVPEAVPAPETESVVHVVKPSSSLQGQIEQYLETSTYDDLTNLIREVLVRFDTDPKRYQKKDYVKLLQMILKIKQYLDLDVEDLDEKFTERTEELDEKIDDTKLLLDTKIDTKVSELNTKIDTTASTLDTKINTKTSELNRKIDSTASFLNNKIVQETSDRQSGDANLQNQIGNISNLQTVAKNNLVSAVNELASFVVKQAEATIDDKVGTPLVTAKIENNKLSLDFKNLKGEQGEVGPRSPYAESDHAIAVQDHSKIETDHLMAQSTLDTANAAVAKVQEMQLGMWPGVAISKTYYQELKSDATKWDAFMAKYNGYMMYVIQSTDTRPITPDPPVPSFRGFGSKFGFVFGGSRVQTKGFGGKFGMLFG